MPVKTLELVTVPCSRLNKEVTIEKHCVQGTLSPESCCICRSAFRCSDSDCKMADPARPSLYIEIP